MTALSKHCFTAIELCSQQDRLTIYAIALLQWLIMGVSPWSTGFPFPNTKNRAAEKKHKYEVLSLVGSYPHINTVRIITNICILNLRVIRVRDYYFRWFGNPLR